MDGRNFDEEKHELLQAMRELNADVIILLDALDKALQKYKECSTLEDLEKIVEELNNDLDTMKHIEVYD